MAAKYECDILSQMVQSEIPQEKKDGSIEYQTTTTEYDNTGNVTEKNEQIDGDRTAKTEYTYDKQGNLVMVKSCMEGDKEPDGSSAQYVQYVYDIQGNKVRQFTGMTEPLTLTVSEVEDAADDADTFSYAGKTYQLTVSGKKKTDTVAETKYEYDGKNQLVAFTDPEGRKETYTYDANSNLTKTVDKNGNTQKSTYDYQNRLTEMVAKEKKTGKETVHTYTYNAYGDVETQDGTAFAYEDASGQVTKETTKLTKHKDVVKTYTYDSAGNKSAFKVKVGDDTKLSLHYNYDGESRLTGVTDEHGSQVAGYSYDTDGNLSEISYTYDGNNNRKEMTAGNKVTAYKYNKNDELLRTDTLNTDTEEDSVVIYKNDKNGNQLATVNRYEIPEGKKDKPYIDIDVTLGDNRLNENVVNHYNAQNQPVRTLTKNYKVSFTYDAEGLRTSKTVNGEKTVFVWDGDQLVMELSEGGKVKKRYVRGNDRGYGSNLVYADKGENTEKQYYVTDPHGNVVQLTDESGKVIKIYEYDSFGNEVKPDGKDDNPFRYCGEYYDKETGEVYLRARYYQPSVGRFLTRDTYIGEKDEPLSLHLYTYCSNDGVNGWDPSGHDAIWLQQTYGAAGFGHTAVSIEIREGAWWYSSFSSTDPYNLILNLSGNTGTMVTSEKGGYKVDYTKKWEEYKTPKGKEKRKRFDKGVSIVKATLNEAANRTNQYVTSGIKYDKYIYMEGNFKKSYDYLFPKAHKKELDYTLIKRNCKNMVVDALKKGTLKGPRREKFKRCLNKAKKVWIPNKAYKIVRDFMLSYPQIKAAR